jgi:hypothetical protein
VPGYNSASPFARVESVSCLANGDCAASGFYLDVHGNDQVSWEYRRPRISAHVHFAVGAVLIGVTILLFFYGYWWGGLLLLAAALHFWLGFYDMTAARSAPPRN